MKSTVNKAEIDPRNIEQKYHIPRWAWDVMVRYEIPARCFIGIEGNLIRTSIWNIKVHPDGRRQLITPKKKEQRKPRITFIAIKENEDVTHEVA